MKDLRVYDGETEIIYSGTFNVYGNKLTLGGVADFEIIFLFEENRLDTQSQMKTVGDDQNKKLTITLINFSNSLGTGTTNKLPILSSEGKTIFFSIFSSSLGGSSPLKQVTVTFYESQ